MKIVTVTYITQAAYAAQNQANIRQVMHDLGEAGHTGIFYTVCVNAAGNSFTHTAYYRSDEDQKVLSGLASFKNFQEQLKASQPETPPKQELLTLVGSSTPIFS